MKKDKLLLWFLLLCTLLILGYLLLVAKSASSDADSATQAAVAELNQACFYQTGQTKGAAFSDCVQYYHTH